MHIININKRSPSRKVTKSQAKDFYFSLAISFFTLLLLPSLAGCITKSAIRQTRGYVEQSGHYYQRALTGYQDLIKKGKDLDRLYLELGRLYFNHGDFQEACEALGKTNDTQAKKLLAISYYRLGNFTDALEIFNKYEIIDDEYLYYHSLTCEKMNLFDQALENYRKIKSGDFKSKALERIGIIEKQASTSHIKDIDPKVYKIIQEAPAQDRYPQAGALILSCDEKIEVTPQLTQISYLHYIVKILNERGKEDFSETLIDYDSTYEKVEIEYARTIKPDGTVAEVGSRHIRDVSKYLNFPLYSNVRICIISFPEITEGSSIEYKLKIYRNQLINKKDLVINYPLQASEPIIAANFTFILPKTKSPHIKILNEKYNNSLANLNPEINEKAGALIYSWQFKDIPQILPESNMPPNVQINPTILISTLDNWQDIYGWWWDLAKDKIKADDAIKSKVSELLRGLDSLEDKIRAICNFCAQKIRYVAVEYGQAGYEPHYASDVFKNKYGDCKDQAILLITMLKEAGFNAWPVLIATKEYYNLGEDFPAVLFNHCIAAVSLKDEVVFLDPTAETCPFQDLPPGDQMRKVLIFKEDGYAIQDTPFFAPGHNLVKQHSKTKLNHDETITTQKSISTLGMYDQAQRFWLLYTPPELIQDTLKEKIQEVSIGATLEKYNIENLGDLNKPIVLSYSFQGPQYLISAGNLRIMPQLNEMDTSMVAKEKRKYPIDFDTLDTREIIFEIEIPDNFVIKYMPANINEDNPWLTFKSDYNFQGNKIFFRQKTELKKAIVTEEEYPAFKKFFEDLAKQAKQRIVLEKIR